MKDVNIMLTSRPKSGVYNARTDKDGRWLVVDNKISLGSNYELLVEYTNIKGKVESVSDKI